MKCNFLPFEDKKDIAKSFLAKVQDMDDDDMVDDVDSLDIRDGDDAQ